MINLFNNCLYNLRKSRSYNTPRCLPVSRKGWACQVWSISVPECIVFSCCAPVTDYTLSCTSAWKGSLLYHLSMQRTPCACMHREQFEHNQYGYKGVVFYGQQRPRWEFTTTICGVIQLSYTFSDATKVDQWATHRQSRLHMQPATHNGVRDGWFNWRDVTLYRAAFPLAPIAQWKGTPQISLWSPGNRNR